MFAERSGRSKLQKTPQSRFRKASSRSDVYRFPRKSILGGHQSAVSRVARSYKYHRVKKVEEVEVVVKSEVPAPGNRPRELYYSIAEALGRNTSSL